MALTDLLRSPLAGFFINSGLGIANWLGGQRVANENQQRLDETNQQYLDYRQYLQDWATNQQNLIGSYYGSALGYNPLTGQPTRYYEPTRVQSMTPTAAPSAPQTAPSGKIGEGGILDAILPNWRNSRWGKALMEINPNLQEKVVGSAQPAQYQTATDPETGLQFSQGRLQPSQEDTANFLVREGVIDKPSDFTLENLRYFDNPQNAAKLESYVADKYNPAGTAANQRDNWAQGFKKLRDQVLGNLKDVGNTERNAINKHYDQQAGEVGASLTRRGLTNSTVAKNMTNAVENERQKALGELDERIANFENTWNDVLTTKDINTQQTLFQNAVNQSLQAGVLSLNGETQTELNRLNLMGSTQTVYDPSLINSIGTAINTYRDQAAYQDYIESQNDSSWGDWAGSAGWLGGAGLGALLAVPTGGMSVLSGAALGGALGGAGGQAISSFDPRSQNFGYNPTSAMYAANQMYTGYTNQSMGSGLPSPTSYSPWPGYWSNPYSG